MSGHGTTPGDAPRRDPEIHGAGAHGADPQGADPQGAGQHGADPLVVGPLTVGPIAHGGHCVARHDGRVIFVRHALPGEEVLVTVTDDSKKSFWRGDATTVLRASEDRVAAPCSISGPGGCGGCDFQHVDLAAQRRLKAAVLAEQLQRLAGLELAVTVEAVPLPGADQPGTSGSTDGFGWRTRMRYRLDEQGRPGMRAHRSHRVIDLPADGCLIAAPSIAKPSIGKPSIGKPSIGKPSPEPSIAELDLAGPGIADSGEESRAAGAGSAEQAVGGSGKSGRAPEGAEVIGVAAADGVHWITDESEPVTEQAAGREWQVAADGFWQVHPAAADLLVATVLDGLRPRRGETAFDLYSGVGLFTGALIDAGCRVTGVESSRAAVVEARRNLADTGSRARFIADRVDRALRRPRGKGALPITTDLVVLDPPRTGAGRAVVDQVAARRPRAIAYVACDPAALARDLGYFGERGYQLDSLRAFDLFPMTHHLECVAILSPRG